MHRLDLVPSDQLDRFAVSVFMSAVASISFAFVGNIPSTRTCWLRLPQGVRTQHVLAALLTSESKLTEDAVMLVRIKYCTFLKICLHFS